MRVAILGAGNAGVCAALELAARGQAVDLYDENAEPITRASRNNEGKVHLGLVYAKDGSLATARTMIWGALHFAACLRRWIDFDPRDGALSTPFHYAVHEGTMTTPAALAAHYAHCRRLFADAQRSTGLSYLDLDRSLVAEEISRPELEALLDPEHFVTAFRTSERAVDPRAIADRLVAAVHASPRIRFVRNARVTDLARGRGAGLRVSFHVDGAEHVETYDQVANCLWHGRLAIDARLGLAPEREWIYRYKVGGWLKVPVPPETVPSLTVVLGPFGDLVDFGRRGLYLSWYPAGMIGTSRELSPPDWHASLTPAAAAAIVRRTHDVWLRRCPGLRALGGPDTIEPAGGVIFAWGASDIDVAESRLHTRHEIGVHSVGGYHSVNTGKYTMTPYLGYETARRILGTE
ncbi:MAG TPA: FAD-dependent oxidoreductase [Candidatus Binatia bacterium]|nr:FAD-dependent oxidoreductase [Candidatus Binatia bacterium]